MKSLLLLNFLLLEGVDSFLDWNSLPAFQPSVCMGTCELVFRYILLTLFFLYCLVYCSCCSCFSTFWRRIPRPTISQYETLPVFSFSLVKERRDVLPF